MSNATTSTVSVREATDDEVAFYRKNGWVKMEGLIPAQLAADMLAAIKDRILDADAVNTAGETAGTPARIRGAKAGNQNAVYDVPAWRDLHYVARDEHLEPFNSLVTSKTIGKNARRFMGREVPVGFHADILAVKMPSGHAAGKPTEFHQDFPNFPFDRVGMLSFWIALEDMPAERGVMRFLSGSQREGSLGRLGFGAGDMTDYYPHLEEEYEMSPPLDLKAGDCTVHNGAVVHGAPENSTDKPRWAYIMSYFPRDIKYNGAQHHIFNAEAGCVLNQAIDTPQFPTVYP